MNRLTLIVVVVEVVFAAVGLGVGWWIGTPILEDARVDLHSGALASAATVPLLVLVLWSLRLENALASRLRQLFREKLIPLFTACSWLDFLVISIMAGIGEEVFFRAFLQGSLGRVVSPWIALALVSVLFGLAHAVSVGYAIATTLIGAYLGALLLLTGNLFVAIAVHALFDFGALLWLTRMPLAEATEPNPR